MLVPLSLFIRFLKCFSFSVFHKKIACFLPFRARRKQASVYHVLAMPIEASGVL
ncbi:hypothetical protein B4168_3757 [Anoxybacillus flavithermus]|nr:hypothetical protein B4168_3757 [Anoxybacillus flavithermus]